MTTTLSDRSKLYVLVPDGVPRGFAINGVAHAGVCAALKWGDDDDFKSWAFNSFRKVTCVADADEIKACEDELVKYLPGEGTVRELLDEHRIVVTESDLDGRVVAVIFKPRDDWPTCFKLLDLWG